MTGPNLLGTLLQTSAGTFSAEETRDHSIFSLTETWVDSVAAPCPFAASKSGHWNHVDKLNLDGGGLWS